MRGLSNHLYIEDFHQIMKRDIKHPGTIIAYNRPYHNCTTDKPLKFIGIDFETEANTGEVMLMGVYFNGFYYSYHKDDCDILRQFCLWVKKAFKEKCTILNWSKFDQNIIIKLFLSEMSIKKRKTALKDFGKYRAKWGHYEWENPLTIEKEYKIGNVKYSFGIPSIIDKISINVSYKSKHMKNPNYVKVLNLNALYKTTIEKACKNNKLTYYTKMNEGFKYKKKIYSYHIIDWNLFKKIPAYKEGVLLSNELDCKAVYDLGIKLTGHFHKAFNCYPKYLHSSGTLAKMALAIMLNKEDYDSLNFHEQMKDWGYFNNPKMIKIVDKMHILAGETYSGGMFNLYNIGMGDVWTADISASYPSAVTKLLDLRDSELIEGKGTPPTPKPNEYIFIRGNIDIPEGCIHTFGMHDGNHQEVIRPIGLIYSCYIWEERELAQSQGAKFKNEEWVIIRTKGLRSPLAEASDELFKLRMQLKNQKNEAHVLVKDANNSCYGITIEGVKEYQIEQKGLIYKGFRAGAMYNPILATLITAYGRVTLCTAMKLIKDNGGKLIQCNTDSIHWQGRKEDLPKDFNTLVGKCGWRDNKTLGYFEEPSEIKEFISLATGRYGGYDVNKGEYICKLRSYIIDINPKEHFLKNILIEYKDVKELKSIEMESKQMITVKLYNSRKGFDIEEICKIENIKKDLIFYQANLKNQCDILLNAKNPIPIILKGFTEVSPISGEMIVFAFQSIKQLNELCHKQSLKHYNAKLKTFIKHTENNQKNYKIYMNKEENRIKKREADKRRKQEARENMSDEEAMIIRFKDRERKRYNKKKALENESR